MKQRLAAETEELRDELRKQSERREQTDACVGR